MVLKDAEKRQWNDDAVKLWMDELKDLSYDMDEVLDEWSIAIIKAEIAKEGSSIANQNASFKRRIKVCFSALACCFNSGPLSQVRHRLDIAHKIENLSGRLDNIAHRKDMFNFSIRSTRSDEPIRPNTSTSIVDVSKVYGQDEYKKILKHRLLCGGSIEGEFLQIIPVVGMGGIGKTTLAKIVYSDGEVKSHFGKRLWVCVSEPFDIVKIANEIIEQLTGRAPPIGGLEVLMQKIITPLKSERFLLVLDDVWTDDYQKWEQLEKLLLSCDAIGSRIIVTTRKVEVARMMGVRDNLMIRVRELSEMDCWLLFRDIAFFGRTEGDREELENIGQEIVLKCNGLPLAAKTLGSLLRIKRTKEEWLEVLQSEIWRLEKVEENLFYPLLLSYFDLSPIEKRCFLYCAVFPKNQVIQKDFLIHMWMSQGYLSLTDNADEVNLSGERCFNNLAMRSFFQDFDYHWEGNISQCKMHDIVHDFAQFLMLNEHSSLVMGNRQEKIELSTRHLTLMVPPGNQSQTSLLSISNKKNLHTLMLLGPEIVDKTVIDWCLQFTSLKTFVLQLSETKDIPESIGDLVHLRYLELCCQRDDEDELTELPSTLGNLCNLQTLFLRGFRLPKEVAKLVNLRYLDCKHCAYLSFISLPKVIGRLRNLQIVSTKLCSSTNTNIKEKFELEDLANLDNLREIWLQNVGIDEGHVDGAIQAQLFQKTNLLRLALFFDERDHTRELRDYETHKRTLEVLQPPPSLTSLAIVRYSGGDIAPSWMLSSSASSPLRHLKVLLLALCPNCETLPPLGKFQSLEVLEIGYMEKLKKIGPEFLGILDILEKEEECNSNTRLYTPLSVITTFPKLKKLKFDSITSWREWVGIESWIHRWNKKSTALQVMPCLERLEFNKCEELEELPDFFDYVPLLKEFFIVDSPKLASAWLPK